MTQFGGWGFHQKSSLYFIHGFNTRESKMSQLFVKHDSLWWLDFPPKKITFVFSWFQHRCSQVDGPQWKPKRSDGPRVGVGVGPATACRLAAQLLNWFFSGVGSSRYKQLQIISTCCHQTAGFGRASKRASDIENTLCVSVRAQSQYIHDQSTHKIKRCDS